MLKARIDALETEERQLAQETVYESSEAIRAAEVAQWAEHLPDLLTAGFCAAEKGSAAKPSSKRSASRAGTRSFPLTGFRPWFAQCQVRWRARDSNPQVLSDNGFKL
jgi:hypothetical protein